jgi:class 3 adenylate cyclase
MYVFLTDIEGSTQLWEEHTPVMTGVIARHGEILRQRIPDTRGAQP